jgi:O-antigen/teichoic acid export membrane protein
MTLAHKRDLMWVGGGRFVTALISLISIRAVTTFLTPEQYGELAILMAVQMFCGLFLVNPVGQHINLNTHAWWDDGTLLARLRSYRSYVTAVSFIGGLIVLGISKKSAVDQLLWTAVAMFAMVAAGTWNATLIPMLNMLGFRAASVLWSIITVAVSLACSILLVVWLSTATAWFAGQAIGMAVGALGARLVLGRNVTRSTHKLPLMDRHTVMTYCVPLAVATGLMWSQLSGYRFLIERYWGLEQLGFMAIGLQMAGQMWALAETLAMQFLYPFFYRRVSENQKQAEIELAFSDLLNTLVPVYLVLTGLLVLSAPYLLKVLVASQFQGALTFVALGAGIELCRVLGNLLSNAAHVKRQTKTLALPYAAGSMTALALIYFASASQLEISGAGAALMAGGLTMLTVMLFCMHLQVRITIDAARWFWSVAVMLALAAPVFYMPTMSSLGASIGMLMLIAVPACIAVVALLWKNPATLRLLDVQLLKN